MAIVYAVLKSEIQNDPKALGYAALVAGNNDQGLADKLNQVGASGETVSAGLIPSYLVINATVAADWTALSANERLRYQTLTGAGQVDTTNPNVQAAFLAMFAAGTATRTALITLATRSASRAEALFGAGTTIDSLDVARALRGTA